MGINQIFKNFWEIREIKYRSIVNFVCRITFFENWCNISILLNIKKITTLYTIIEKICVYLRVNMNRADHDFNWTSLKVLALFSDSSLIVFVIPVSLNSRKVNISLLLKCFLIFLGELFLKCLNTNCFRDFFFRARDIFFDLRVFLKFVKYLFRVCDVFLLPLIILLFSWLLLAVLLY